MALARRRDSSLIWPGFVDAVTTLLMVMMFVLTIFTVMQSVLRDTITTQDNELDALAAQVADLADALGLERARASDLEGEVGSLTSALAAAEEAGSRQEALIATLQSTLAAREGDLASAEARITDFEAQVASLLSERDAARGEAVALGEERDRLLDAQAALDLALAKAREEIDAGAEAARKAAAEADALEALIASLRAEAAAQGSALSEATAALDAAEAARLVDLAALEALRERLKGSDTELAAMTLALEEARKRAEETLTLLAAAQTEAARNAEGAGEQADLLATAEAALLAEKDRVLKAAREVALLNQQVTALRAQLGELQGLLDASVAADVASKVQLETLGRDLNAALARAAASERRRAELEEAERKRLEAEAQGLEAEAQELARFRSEFFGELSRVLAGREGIRVVGDRFVFSSEVLFASASADLSAAGAAQIADVVGILNDIRDQIPPGIDWVIRVDGHTDATPLSGAGPYEDNWELSQARALSVVRFMQDQLGFPPDRLAATGFGEFRPVASGDSDAALAANRRIEIKLTER